MSQAFDAENFTLSLNLTPKVLAEKFGISVQALHKFIKEHNINVKKESRHIKLGPESVREIVELRGLKIPKMVIDLHNVKGGVGKSTCTHALATRAAAYGARVLMIDLDQQANLTGSFGIHGHPKAFPTVMDVYNKNFNGKAISVDDAIIRLNDFLHIIPSNLSMANLDTLLSLDTNLNIQTFFENLLGEVRNNYDFIFFDSPPSLSKLTSAAHIYSDLVLMPVEPDKFSLDGLELNFEHIEKLRSNFNLNNETRVFINKYDARPKIDLLIASELTNSDYGADLCESAVRYASGLKAAIAEGKCVWNADKKNVALEDLDSLFLEISDIENSWKSKKVETPAQTYISQEVNV